jgi:hypothetical protein
VKQYLAGTQKIVKKLLLGKSHSLILTV